MRTSGDVLELALPATSANLGPGFDAAALALDLFLTIRARRAPRVSIRARGRNADICQRLEDHLILNTYRDILVSEGRPVAPLALNIQNQIPIGKGCGSSAAARLAGIILAVHFGGLGWGKAAWNPLRIVGEASRLEHHPDNAAACWYGALAVARVAANGEAYIARLQPQGEWPLLLAVPEATLSTERARRVLPDQYSQADAVLNIQNAMLLLAAFLQGRPELLPAALEDRLHQPYRSALCPLLPVLQQLKVPDVLGVALSGAGPSVLVFLAPGAALGQVRRRIRDHLRQAGLAAELISTSIARRGAQGVFSSRR
jgi:homoserine kinase